MKMVICADNDRLTSGNPGLAHAISASIKYQTGLAVPVFDGDLGTDFNDMIHYSNIDLIRNILLTATTATTATKPLTDLSTETKRYALRPYQQRALNEIKQAIRDGYRSIMIQSPTGSGKGVMLSNIINLCNEKGSSVLFLVHRQEILYQVSTYMNHYGISHGIIKAGEVHEDSHNIQLASFQTIHRRLKSSYIRKADVIIVDEAHHATAATFQNVIKTFKKPDAVILGFSATPSRQSGEGLGNMFDKLIHVATIQELTDLKYLSPVRVYAPIKPDLAGVKVVAGDYHKSELETAMNKSQLIGDIVEHWFKFGNNRKTVCFATGIKHSLAICQQFHSAGITAAHLDGNTPKDERESILERFKSGLIKVIVNCMILTEGVDVPDIGCVILARPTKSLPMYLQMVGRGMRTIEGKTDCILLDHSGAVHLHGFPDEITDWELSTTSKTINKKQEKRKKNDSEPIECPICRLLYTGRLQCPGCGNIPTTKQIGKDIDYIDGELGELVRKSTKKAKEPVIEDKELWCKCFKLYAKSKGYADGWVYHKMIEKFGAWSHKFKYLTPATEMMPEVLNWLQYTNIKRAKSPIRSV